MADTALLDALRGFQAKLDAYREAHLERTKWWARSRLADDESRALRDAPGVPARRRFLATVESYNASREAQAALRAFSKLQPGLAELWGRIEALARAQDVAIPADAGREVADAIIPTPISTNALEHLRMIERVGRVVVPMLVGVVETSEQPFPKSAPKTDWHDVQARLVRLCDSGEAYTSQRDLAKRLDCSAQTINKAIRKSPILSGWMARHRDHSPKAQSLNEVVTDNIPSQQEPDPANYLPDDESEQALRKLIEDHPEVRAELNAMDAEQRRQTAKLLLEQQRDQHIQEKSRNGNRILGRKP